MSTEFNLGTMKVIPITFKHNESGEEFTIEISSHYTCISNDSGSGKTCFIDMLSRSLTTNEISVVCELPVHVATLADIDAFLNYDARCVIIIDESTVLNSKYALLPKLNRSKHLIICVSRAQPGCCAYAYQSLFSLRFTDAGFFEIERLCPFDITDIVKGDLLCESAPDRSEHAYFGKDLGAIPVSGKNNFIKYIQPNKEYTIFTDLGGIGSTYQLFDSEDVNRIRFYNYQAFEQLFVDSPILRNDEDVSNFDFVTTEQYYEYLALHNKEVSVRHGKPLPNELLSLDRDKILDSSVGWGIRDALRQKIKKSHLF